MVSVFSVLSSPGGDDNQLPLPLENADPPSHSSSVACPRPFPRHTISAFPKNHIVRQTAILFQINFITSPLENEEERARKGEIILHRPSLGSWLQLPNGIFLNKKKPNALSLESLVSVGAGSASLVSSILWCQDPMGYSTNGICPSTWPGSGMPGKIGAKSWWDGAPREQGGNGNRYEISPREVEGPSWEVGREKRDRVRDRERQQWKNVTSSPHASVKQEWQ